MIYTVENLRKAAWHLRSGGIGQLRTWHRRQRAMSTNKMSAKNITASPAGAKNDTKDRQLTFPAFDYPSVVARRDDLTVAVILDNFSAKAFAYEWNLVFLAKDRWREQLEQTRVDFLFVESAWEGNDGSWRYQLTGTSGPKPEFLNLMQWCRENSLPTVFWNKEDPPHFEDFLPAAREFDVVLTSDENKLPAYRELLGHNRIEVLPFAAQPAIHNPVRPKIGRHSRDVAFAGMYFAHKYPERRDQMQVLLDGAMEGSDRVKHGLEIFSRQLGGRKRPRS